MVKLIGEPVKISRKEYSIGSFVWRGRLYRVDKVIGWWREPSEWWNGEEIRQYLRVIATNSSTGIYELCKLDGQWLLDRVLD